MKLQLPDVTLVMMDCTCPELARLAWRDTMELIEPGKLIWVSDSPPPSGINWHSNNWVAVEKWNTVQEYCEFLWYTLPPFIETKWMLSIQWDGWVVDPTQWDSRFLDYDYVGAPWWYPDTHNVGNGTGLRSKRLMQYLLDHRDVFPVEGKEDELLCRTYRSTLERHGFRWAPERLASKFSLECVRPAVFSKHFMFHDSFNFPAVLTNNQLTERIKLMKQSPYIQGTQKLKELEQGRKAMILDRLAP